MHQQLRETTACNPQWRGTPGKQLINNRSTFVLIFVRNAAREMLQSQGPVRKSIAMSCAEDRV
jgi:hypothetical protein